MRITILPKTHLGWWSFGLAIAWILFLVLSEVVVGFGVFGSESNFTFAVNLTIIVVAIGGAALITGLVGILKSKERAILVFLSTAIGLYGVMLSISEMGHF